MLGTDAIAIEPLSVIGQRGEDPAFADVALLVDFDGVDGATTETDDSNDNRTLTFQNTAQLSDAQSPFGTTSLDTLNRRNAGVDVSPVIDFNGSNWTIEAFVFLTSAVFFDGHSRSVILDSGDDFSFVLGTDLVEACLNFLSDVGTNGPSIVDPGAFPLNEWVHVAVTRDGSLFRLWNAGVKVGEASAPNAVFNNTEGHLRIGDQLLVNGRQWHGYLGPMRITMATRYTGDFTPPTETFPTS